MHFRIVFSVVLTFINHIYGNDNYISVVVFLVSVLMESVDIRSDPFNPSLHYPGSPRKGLPNNYLPIKILAVLKQVLVLMEYH